MKRHTRIDPFLQKHEWTTCLMNAACSGGYSRMILELPQSSETEENSRAFLVIVLKPSLESSSFSPMVLCQSYTLDLVLELIYLQYQHMLSALLKLSSHTCSQLRWLSSPNPFKDVSVFNLQISR